MRMTRRWKASALSTLVVAGACAGPDTAALPPCDPGNGGITLPEGFCATVVADGLGRIRHLAVRDDGDIFVALYESRDQPGTGGVLALRDTTGDGKADVTVRFGPGQGGSGIALRGDRLYFATDDAVLRYTVPAGALEPTAGPDTIVSGLPADRSHRAKSIVLAADGGRLFVNIGSPTNACQVEDRQPQSPGRDPCPDLELRAGIWVFDAQRTGQTQADGQRYATGIRNAVAVELHPETGGLWALQHGRDNLSSNWGFSDAASAEKPAEEMLRIDEGDDFGWPYCYFDPALSRKVLAPEYGGDGQEEGRCADKERPVFAFPAHWAPNDLLFYTGSQFPTNYQSGAFIAFHGSWNRAPLPQGGYNVVFLPFNAGAPLADFQVFADDFAGAEVEPGAADHRPTGLAQGADGSVYITDDMGGRIWRVMYPGP